MSPTFVDGQMEVHVACGYEYEPMKIQVTEFVPDTEETSSRPTISTGPSNGDPVFIRRYLAPVGLKKSAMNNLVEICRSHVKSMAVKQREGRTNRQMNNVSKRLLRAINVYHKSRSPSLNVCFVPHATGDLLTLF
jgi:hypothetical protein